MGLDMVVEKITDTTLLKNHTLTELYQYMEVHNLLKILETYRFLEHEIRQHDLEVSEIEYLLTQVELPYRPTAASPKEYYERFCSNIRELQDRLRNLPSLPLAFTQHPPTLPMVESKYWRKANAIHVWFVEHVQNGVDDCELYLIPYEMLKHLKHTIEAILNAENERIKKQLSRLELPPKKGFFFDEADIDTYYFQELEETLEWLTYGVDWERYANGEVAYVYHSS